MKHYTTSVKWFGDNIIIFFVSRRSSCAQWTTAAWCPRSSGSTPPRTTSPSPWSRCCFLPKIFLTILLTILLMFKLLSHIQSLSPAQTAASPGDPHIHLIPSVLPSHSGTYSCVAENVLGQVTSSETKIWRTETKTIDNHIFLCGRVTRTCVTENSNVHMCYTTCSSAQWTHELPAHWAKHIKDSGRGKEKDNDVDDIWIDGDDEDTYTRKPLKWNDKIWWYIW